MAGFFVIRRGDALLLLPLYAFIHLPVLAAATLFDGDDALAFWGSPELQAAVFRTVLGSSCGVAGYAIMQAKVPERFFPGKLDLLFHSHQWWHVLTIVGPVLCMQAGQAMLHVRLSSGEDDAPPTSCGAAS